MTEYADRLAEEYRSAYEKYSKFTEDISSLVETLLNDSSIEYQTIESRTKSTESFLGKVDRPEKAQKYATCRDITDLSGIRIIAYLQEDRDRICSLIEQSFKIDFENSIKKEELLGADQFGYRSAHYVVSYTDNRLQLPEFAKFQGLRAEIQVRTLLQHTWAAIDWKLRYKTEFDVPKELKRKLYRISALLEVADDNFSELSRAVKSLREDYKEKIVTGNFDIDINRESIELFISDDPTVHKILNIAEESGYTICPPAPNSRNPYNNLLMTLSSVDLKQINKLKDLLDLFLSSGGSALREIFNCWSSPGKPKKLVIDASELIRICVITTVGRSEAKAMLDRFPFGPELQRSILQIINSGPSSAAGA